jgi:hypothetical protein
MARKNITLPPNFKDIIDSGDFKAFKNVFDKCEITATNRGKTTSNAFSYENLTPKHIQFLVEQGLEINADCGFGHSAIFFHSDNKENLRCLIENGADINYVDIWGYTALSSACSSCKAIAVKNLLEANASIKVAEENKKASLLDVTLMHCANALIVDALEISKTLIKKGCTPTNNTKDFVREIGKRFEFCRGSFNKEYVDAYSEALNDLYELFDVEPVPRISKHDGKSPIKVNSVQWQDQFNELWYMLVPASGKAEILQGEMIRIVGRLSHEILDNGGINWYKRYDKLRRELLDYLNLDSKLNKKLTNEACKILEGITASSNEASIYRLTEIIVKWVLENPEPIALDDIGTLRKRNDGIGGIRSFFKRFF